MTAPYTFESPNGYVYGMWALMRYGGKYTGSYPNGFIKRVKLLLGQGEYLHVFSGSVRGDTTFDGDSAGNPTKVGLIQDGLPWSENTFDVTMGDPPYAQTVGSTRGQKLPTLKLMLQEMTRVTKPGGKVALLHWIVPATPEGCDKWGCIGVMTGANKKLRAFTVFKKQGTGE